METLKVQIKNVYGNDLVFPVCDKAKLLCELAGQKTFTVRSSSIVKKLGYKFEIVNTPNAVLASAFGD